MESGALLQELRKAGLVSEEDAVRLKRDTLISERSVEDLIYERRFADGRAIAELKAKLLKVPLKKVDIDHYDKGLLELVPEETARTYAVAPIAKQGNLLVVGMLSPDDPKAQEALKFIARRSRLNLGIYLIAYEDWQSILQIYSPYKGKIEAAVQSLNIKTDGGRRFIRLEEGGSNEDAPVIRIVADTLREAVQAQASDVHIEPQEKHVRIRFRVDGDLKEITSLPVELAEPVVSRVKVMSNLKLDEHRVPQDGRFRSKIFDREIDFRVSTFPTPLGEKVAIRILDPATGLKDLERLGLVGKNAELVNEAIRRPYGMVLITGPTGSGKSTTLYALLQKLNEVSVNIVSLEDPVEYFVSGVNQSQVRPEIGYDFASGLRQILRQDPDVIMVGEIRDDETAELAVHAALTGHIVLSTLHTNNAVGVIPRLIDMKVEAFLLPAALNIMVAQRLVSLLCQNCKVPSDAPETVARVIKKTLSELPSDIAGTYHEPYQIYHAPGCPKCKGRGVTGRIALFEAFRMTPQLAEIIYKEPNTQRIFEEARRQGMLTLRQDGVLKALGGQVAMEEVLRESEEI